MEVHRVKIPSDNDSLFNFPLNKYFNFDRYVARDWMEQNWTISLYGIGVYALFIYFGQEYMKNRKPMDLKRALAIWNFTLAAFSITGTVSVISEFIFVLRQEGGFHSTVCAPCSEISDSAVFWGWMFCMTKLAELIDTVFIVLRKRPLIFLHFYHHITVLLYAWYFYSDEIAPARWFIMVNFIIHSVMYTYYSLRSIGVYIPKPIAMAITVSQLSQMVIGVYVNVYAYKALNRGEACDVKYHHLHVGLGLYASYFVLFGNYFYWAYFKGKGFTSIKGTKTE